MNGLKYLMVICLLMYMTLANADAYISGKITGKVTSEEFETPVENAILKTNAGRSAISFSDGTFIIDHESGEYTLTVLTDNYEPYSVVVVVQRYQTIDVEIKLKLRSIKPIISSVSDPQTLLGEKTASIFANNVLSINDIERIEAIIVCPQNPQKIELDEPYVLPFKNISGTNDYSLTYDNFEVSGTYQISVVATDTAGNTSITLTTTIIQSIGPDAFEPDNLIDEATVVILNSPKAQKHTFHSIDDEDWIKFYINYQITYTIEISNMEKNAYPIIEVYDCNETLQFTQTMRNCLVNGTAIAEWPSIKEWSSIAEGIYYIRIINQDKNISEQDIGYNTGYDIRIIVKSATLPGLLYAKVYDEKNKPLKDTMISINDTKYVPTFPNGSYAIYLEYANYSDVTVIPPLCYHRISFPAIINVLKKEEKNIHMKRIGLQDTISALQIMTGFYSTGEISMNEDINQDNIIGLHEVIYSLGCLEE